MNHDYTVDVCVDVDKITFLYGGIPYFIWYFYMGAHARGQLILKSVTIKYELSCFYTLFLSLFLV